MYEQDDSDKRFEAQVVKGVVVSIVLLVGGVVGVVVDKRGASQAICDGWWDTPQQQRDCRARHGVN